MTDIKFFSNWLLKEMLLRASNEERQALTNVLDGSSNKPFEAEELQSEICRFAGHGLGNLMRGGGVAYSELLFDAAKSLNIESLMSRYENVYKDISIVDIDKVERLVSIATPDLRLICINVYIDQIERQILAKLMAVAYEKATPEQRTAVDAQLAELVKTSHGKSLSGLSTGTALLAIGNVGGFATYTLMSSLLSTLSFGTLGFGAYTFASSLLSVVLGPVGWLALGVYSVVKFGGPNEPKVVQLAATCALISQRLREAHMATETCSNS